MIRRAIVVGTADKAEARLASFLNLLGIEWEILTPAALLTRHGLEILAGTEIQACLILCGEGLRELRSEVDKSHFPAASIGMAFAGSLIHSLDRSPTSLRTVEDFFDGVRIAAPKISSEH